MIETNPYTAPQADVDPTSQPTRRSVFVTFRMIPVFYFGFCALVGSVSLIAMLGMIIWTFWHDGDLDKFIRSRHFIEMLMTIPAYIVFGLMGFRTARSWYACRWKHAILMSIGVFSLIVLGTLFSLLILRR